MRKKIRKNRKNEGNNDTLTVDKYKPLGPLGSCVVYGVVLCGYPPLDPRCTCYVARGGYSSQELHPWSAYTMT
jgi:hypothetical protein